MERAERQKQKIEYRKTDGLIPFVNNARTHSGAQVGQIAASIKEFGFTNPILVDGADGIIAGHGRVMAAKKLGLAEVPVIVLSSLSEAQKRAYVLADNKLALNAGWNDDLLRIEMGALREMKFDLDLTGFSEGELDKLLAGGKGGLTDEDETPEPPVVPVSASGDVWRLGGHRVMSGDSTSAEAVAALLGGAKPHLMVTDPPYGVEYDANWRNGTVDDSGVVRGKVGKGGMAIGKVLNDGRADWSEAWALFPGNIAYVWHAGNYAGVVQRSLEAIGFKTRAQIIWAKSNFAIGRGDYHWKHEPCWYAVKGTGNWTGDRKQSTVWDIPKPLKSETGHSTQKPVECMRRPLINNSKAGDAVYDPFLGSGTTVIAAETEGRVCYGMELNPAYVDVIVRRWESFTGNKATLEATGKSFEEVERGRKKGK